MSKHSKEIDPLDNFTGEARPSDEVIAEGINPEGFSSMFILGNLYMMFLAVAVVIVGTIFWIKKEHQSVLDKVSLESEPRELRQAEANAARKLTQYGQINQEEGVYRVPIDRAIDLIMEEEWKEGAQNADGREEGVRSAESGVAVEASIDSSAVNQEINQ